LLEYWLDYPPVHLLLRSWVGYKSRKGSDHWREQRAEEMGDSIYQPEKPIPAMDEKDSRVAAEFTTGAKHLDCAPGHVQEAIARLKRGEHMKVPNNG